MEFFPEVDVSALQAEAIARGLYAVAMVDGVHERELALITEFYRGAVEGNRAWPPPSIAWGPSTPRTWRQLLLGPTHRQLFVKAAYLLAWADGEVSEGERSRIAEFAEPSTSPPTSSGSSRRR
jgi:hypothetical protein